MSLYEEGRFQLTEPLSKYIPAFADMKVYAGGLRKNAAGEFEWDEVEAESEITIQQILNHTGGLSYGFDAPVSTAAASLCHHAAV